MPARLAGLGERVVTGYRSKYFRHTCMDGCYYEQLPDWSDLIDECFPRRIRPTDIDGMVEINGHFLFLEEKRCGVGPDEGQRRALRKLSRRKGITTVFFRPALPGDADKLQVLIFDQCDPEGWQDRTRGWLKEWLADWCASADREPVDSACEICGEPNPGAPVSYDGRPDGWVHHECADRDLP